MILDPTDQNIRDQGFNFVPFDRYLADSFQPKTLDMSGIQSLGVSGSIPSGRFGIVNPNINVSGDGDDEENELDRTNNFGINSFSDLMQSGFYNNPATIGFNTFGLPGAILGTIGAKAFDNFSNQYTDVLGNLNKQTKQAILEDYRDSPEGQKSAKDYADLQKEIGQSLHGDNDGGGNSGKDDGGEGGYGGFCFDPNTPVQMADGSEKKIKEIQLGDQTKGGEVTGVFQFKASDEIHDYKGVTVAGSHYVKEDGKFIMVQDSPISVKIDKIPVVYSLDTTGRRIFIKDIEFADYNGDGIAKGFLANAGVGLKGFDKEVLRQVENRLI